MLSPIATQFDIPGIYDFYSHNRNYEILDLKQDDDRCFIYFSSNSIYAPNTREAFEQKLIRENRFDWKNNIVTSSRKAIFIRDILKTWYIKGINSEINSIEKILEFLKQETKGLRVTCVGSSAGGYAATLFGSLLEAERVFNFSGQFSLFKHIEPEDIRIEHPLLVENEHVSEINQYFSLISYIQNSSVPVFYFYPNRCDLDKPQAQEVASLSTVYSYAFNAAEHARTCYPVNLLDLLIKSNDELISLHLKHKCKVIHPLDFSLSVSGFRKTLAYGLKRKMKRRR